LSPTDEDFVIKGSKPIEDVEDAGGELVLANSDDDEAVSPKV
jgi:hypothetical protein